MGGEEVRRLQTEGTASHDVPLVGGHIKLPVNWNKALRLLGTELGGSMEQQEAGELGSPRSWRLLGPGDVFILRELEAIYEH